MQDIIKIETVSRLARKFHNASKLLFAKFKIRERNRDGIQRQQFEKIWELMDELKEGGYFTEVENLYDTYSPNVWVDVGDMCLLVFK